MLEDLTLLLWGWPTLGLFLATGLYFSLRTGFYQCFGLRRWWRRTAGSLCVRGSQGGLGPLETLSCALAATIGTGSVAGVATALTLGGPGALFWMWCTGVLAMMTGWAEKVLSVAVRRRREQDWQGGPALWLEAKDHSAGAALFTCCTLLASLGMGDLVQSNSMAQAASSAWGIPPWAVGIAGAGIVGLTVRGGLKRLARVCSLLVPGMGLLYLAGGLGVIAAHADTLPAVLTRVWQGALGREALASGSWITALQWGLARGVVSNEAGLGSTALLHCQSANNDPAREGDWGIFEVFLSTMTVCTVTALASLTTGASGEGAQQAAAAFAALMGEGGRGFVALCLALFGLSSLLGWSWYGRSAWEQLTGGRWAGGYDALFLALCVAGSVLPLRAVWQLSDCCNALMAWPALLALWLWRREILSFRCEG